VEARYVYKIIIFFHETRALHIFIPNIYLYQYLFIKLIN